jgi:uncharacterized membrane protein
MAIQQVTQRLQKNTQTTSGLKHRIERIVTYFSNFLLEYWAHLFTILVGTAVAIALSIPFLFYFGLNSLASPLFDMLHFVCAQIPSHSFYILGYQVGFCARNLSIYSSMFAGGVIFLLSKKRFPGIPWWLFVLMALPMAWDGFTQMFGLRESTWELRVITGTLFGLGAVWFTLPLIQKLLTEDMPMPHPQNLQEAL